MHLRAVILLSGYPATGKTSYADWLGQHRGFAVLHLEDDAAARSGFTGDPAGFVLGCPRPSVIDWGCNPSQLGSVRQAQQAGADAWWFDGDRVAARRAFLARPDHPGTVADLDRQDQAIRASTDAIQATYGAQVIITLDADGHVEPWENVYRRMFPDCEG
jgi:hypothetical protein